MQEFNDDGLEHGRATTADRKHQDDSEEGEDERQYAGRGGDGVGR